MNAESVWLHFHQVTSYLSCFRRNKVNQSERAIAVKNGVRMSLMQLITSRRGYSGVDNSQLAQYLGAIKVMCDDPR